MTLGHTKDICEVSLEKEKIFDARAFREFSTTKKRERGKRSLQIAA